MPTWDSDRALWALDDPERLEAIVRDPALPMLAVLTPCDHAACGMRHMVPWVSANRPWNNHHTTILVAGAVPCPRCDYDLNDDSTVIWQSDVSRRLTDDSWLIACPKCLTLLRLVDARCAGRQVWVEWSER